MKRLGFGLIPAMGLLVSACGGPADCASKIGEVDALVAKGVTMTETQAAEVAALRAEGTTLQAAGKEAECLKAIDGAKAIVQRALDAELLNKSDG